MNLAQIKYFLALCEVGRFTGAAAICGISQQSLSAAIRRLEHGTRTSLVQSRTACPAFATRRSRQTALRGNLGEIDKVHQLSSERITHSGND